MVSQKPVVVSAGPNEPFWMQNICHQGIAAFNAKPAKYQMFRNILDFGARGEGRTDNTAAIKYIQYLAVIRTSLLKTTLSPSAAMSHGNRCGNGKGDPTTYVSALPTAFF
jgi:hypothetical protein